MKGVDRLSHFVAILIVTAIGFTGPVQAANEEETAALLVKLLQVGRMVVSNHQDLINDPTKGEKGFTSAYLRERVAQIFKEQTNIDLNKPARNEQSQLLQALLESEQEVISDYQPVINKQGIGFKGVLPAVFARKAGEKFYQKRGIGLKLTALEVRYPANKPDPFEAEVLKLFSDPRYPKGRQYSKTTLWEGRQVLRAMEPEYASPSCLKCHGEPRGERDITGMKKEGYKEGGLAGAISVTMPIKN